MTTETGGAAESTATHADTKSEAAAKPRSDLDTARRVYAEEIRVKAGLRSRALFAAFAAVPRAGERALHVGCGVGYYTAIMAEVVGPRGQVVGVEIDAALAERARKNLSHFAHVEVLHADGGEVGAGAFDAIFVNAGATHPRTVWLDGLRRGGRLVLPLTAEDGRGALLRVAFDGRAHAASFVSTARVFHCAGSRDAEAGRLLRGAPPPPGPSAVRSLRRDAHEADATCWLHLEGCCLSTLPTGREG